MDYEVEVGMIIGREGKYIKEENAQDYVFGYCIVNDISERSWQKERGGQWIKGKSIAGPTGPCWSCYRFTFDPLTTSFFLPRPFRYVINDTITEYIILSIFFFYIFAFSTNNHSNFNFVIHFVSRFRFYYLIIRTLNASRALDAFRVLMIK